MSIENRLKGFGNAFLADADSLTDEQRQFYGGIAVLMNEAADELTTLRQQLDVAVKAIIVEVNLDRLIGNYDTRLEQALASIKQLGGEV